MTIMASVCSLVVATGVQMCTPPVPFDEARVKVAEIMRVYDPRADSIYTYLKPVSDAHAPASMAAPPRMADPYADDETRRLNTYGPPRRYGRK